MATISGIYRAAWPQEDGVERILIEVEGLHESEVKRNIEMYLAEYAPNILSMEQPLVIQPWKSVRGDGDAVYIASVEFTIPLNHDKRGQVSVSMHPD